MKKAKTYERVLFSADAVADAYGVFQELCSGKASLQIANVERGPEEWGFDNLDEFLAEMRLEFNSVSLRASGTGVPYRSLAIRESASWVGPLSTIEVTAPQRGEIQRTFEVFERHAEHDRVQLDPPSLPKPTIFIGHGRDSQWRDLRDHLSDKHGYRVEAYEIGAQAGFSIQAILGTKLEQATMALLVLTAEDAGADGVSRPRQNVVHELGLFQGRLGFPKAIAIVEVGTEDFSNLQGTEQIRFKHGQIAATFGDVLATLRREAAQSRGGFEED